MNHEQFKHLLSICLWTIDGLDSDTLEDLRNDCDISDYELKTIRTLAESLHFDRLPLPLESELRLHLSQISSLIALSRTCKDTPDA